MPVIIDSESDVEITKPQKVSTVTEESEVELSDDDSSDDSSDYEKEVSRVKKPKVWPFLKQAKPLEESGSDLEGFVVARTDSDSSDYTDVDEKSDHDNDEEEEKEEKPTKRARRVNKSATTKPDVEKKERKPRAKKEKPVVEEGEEKEEETKTPKSKPQTTKTKKTPAKAIDLFDLDDSLFELDKPSTSTETKPSALALLGSKPTPAPKEKQTTTTTTPAKKVNEPIDLSDDEDEKSTAKTETTKKSSVKKVEDVVEPTETTTTTTTKPAKEKKAPTSTAKKAKKSTFNPFDLDDSLFELDGALPTSSSTEKGNNNDKKKDDEEKPIVVDVAQDKLKPVVEATDDDDLFDPIPPSTSQKSATPAQKDDKTMIDDDDNNNAKVTAVASTKKEQPKSTKKKPIVVSVFDDDDDDDMLFGFANKSAPTVAATKKNDDKQKKSTPTVTNAKQIDNDDDNDNEKQLHEDDLVQLEDVKPINTKQPIVAEKKPVSVWDMDDDDDIFFQSSSTAQKRKEPTPATKKTNTESTKSSSTKSKRTFIDDDEHADDDDDDEGLFSQPTPKQQSSQQKSSQKTSSTPNKKKASPFPANTMNDDSDDGDDDDDIAPKAAKLTNKAIDSAKRLKDAQDTTHSNIDAWGENHFDPKNVSWEKGSKVPYAAFASVLAKCEATTKRLEITSYLSDFFRAIIYNSPDHLIPVMYMVLCEVAPAFEGKEMGVGDGMLERAVAEVIGLSPANLKVRMKEIGDLGAVAEQYRSKQSVLLKAKPLFIQDVFDELRKLPDITGKSSQEAKRGVIKKLLVNAQGVEVRYITRAFTGKLRISLGLQTALRALSQAVVKTPPDYIAIRKQYGNRDQTALDDLRNENFWLHGDDSGDDDDDSGDESDSSPTSTTTTTTTSASKKKQTITTTAKKGGTSMSKAHNPQYEKFEKAFKIIETAYNEGPSFDRILPELLQYPLKELKNRCMLSPGLPIKVMLGKPGTSVDFAINKLTPTDDPAYRALTAEQKKNFLTWEYKYDGERAQIHRLKDGTVKVYSRHMENYTSKYPDVIKNVERVINQLGKPKTESFILDAEIVAWDPVKKRILPFQKLTTRKRKDANLDDIQVQVQMYPFDMLYVNGKSLMKTCFAERRALLHQHFTEIEGVLQYAQYVNGSEDSDIDGFLQRAIVDSCEGLMVKPLYTKSSLYVPDKRKWIKIKKDYMDGAGDTIDLVILGAKYGKGKRTGVYGTYFFYSYDPDEECYYSTTRIGTGYSDEILEQLANELNKHIIDEPQADYVFNQQSTGNLPDVWFEPHLVAEVRCADLTASPEYMNAHGSANDKDGNECGIGLRFPRFLRLRNDKPPTQATPPSLIAEMYYNQSSVRQ